MYMRQRKMKYILIKIITSFDSDIYPLTDCGIPSNTLFRIFASTKCL
jgi:hypothetical protein